MKAAIFGLPMAGKRTLFSLLCGIDVSASHKKVIEGQVIIKDPRIDTLSAMYKPKKTVYPLIACQLFTNLTDLKQKSSESYAQIVTADVIIPVIRHFQDDSVYHQNGTVDPQRDLSTLLSDLMISDMEFIEKRLENIRKSSKKDPASEQELKILERLSAVLEDDILISKGGLDQDTMEYALNANLLTAKPVLPVFNIGEDDIAQPEVMPDCILLPVKTEAEISQITDQAEKDEFMALMGIEDSSIHRFTHSLYKKLGYLTFFTVGADEVRGWTIPAGSTAPQAAGAIHSDLERGFIRAEIMKYKDLIDAGTEDELKKLGKFHIKGKDYIIEDGDICHIRFSV